MPGCAPVHAKRLGYAAAPALRDRLGSRIGEDKIIQISTHVGQSALPKRIANRISRFRRRIATTWHKLSRAVVLTPIARLPFAHGTLLLAAVIFAQNEVFRDLADDLILDPLPEPDKGTFSHFDTQTQGLYT